MTLVDVSFAEAHSSAYALCVDNAPGIEAEVPQVKHSRHQHRDVYSEHLTAALPLCCATLSCPHTRPQHLHCSPALTSSTKLRRCYCSLLTPRHGRTTHTCGTSCLPQNLSGCHRRAAELRSSDRAGADCLRNWAPLVKQFVQRRPVVRRALHHRQQRPARTPVSRGGATPSPSCLADCDLAK